MAGIFDRISMGAPWTAAMRMFGPMGGSSAPWAGITGTGGMPFGSAIGASAGMPFDYSSFGMMGMGVVGNFSAPLGAAFGLAFQIPAWARMFFGGFSAPYSAPPQTQPAAPAQPAAPTAVAEETEEEEEATEPEKGDAAKPTTAPMTGTSSPAASATAPTGRRGSRTAATATPTTVPATGPTASAAGAKQWNPEEITEFETLRREVTEKAGGSVEVQMGNPGEVVITWKGTTGPTQKDVDALQTIVKGAAGSLTVHLPRPVQAPELTNARAYVASIMGTPGNAAKIHVREYTASDGRIGFEIRYLYKGDKGAELAQTKTNRTIAAAVAGHLRNNYSVPVLDPKPVWKF